MRARTGIAVTINDKLPIDLEIPQFELDGDTKEEIIRKVLFQWCASFTKLECEQNGEDYISKLKPNFNKMVDELQKYKYNL